MTNLSDLIERVRAATGPDRALSAAVHFAVLGNDVPYHDTLHCTASVDAAFALAERVLPGRHMAMSFNGGTMPSVVIAATWMGQAKTLPLAITLATLLALQSQEPS